jgi:internalin A
MTIDGLYFPDKIQNLKKAASFDELKVSTGEPRYFKDKEGFWGFNLGNCGLTQEDWDDFQNGNSNQIINLKIAHLGNLAKSKAPNTVRHFGLYGKNSLVFVDISHNLRLESIYGLKGAPVLEKFIATDCPKLKEIKLEGDFLKLSHLEAARSSLTKFTLGNSPQLRFLELSHNQLEHLSIPASCQQLEYLFAQKNQLKTVDFEGDILILDIIDLKDNPLEDDALRGLANQEEQEGKAAAIVAYFQRQREGQTKPIKRVKLIFLGNTGVGKTTLADLLTGTTKATPKHEEDDVSTHGINLFGYQPKDTEIEVQGFDFGGQDYFHNTHFAFFEQNALYMLLWGNGQEDKLDYSKKEERRFPLSYWLGSVNYFLKTRNKDGEPSNTLHLLQNISSKNGQVLELDNRSLKTAYPFLKELRSFGLHDEHQKPHISEWLDAKITEFCKPISVNVIDDAVATFIKKQKRVILPLAALRKATSKTKGYGEDKLRYLAQALHGTLACFYQPPSAQSSEATRLNDEQHKALDENLVADLEQFTNWIYVILAPEMKGDGYFTQKQAENRLGDEAKQYIDFILGFMLQHKIIFKAGESTKEAGQRYVSPHYLSEKQSLTEQLFLSSFEEPLVKYHFREFFHTNLIAEVMLEYYHQLLRDGKWQYVMWKNKVILYEENDKKKLLLIDFEEEEDTNTKEKIASIRLHRFIKNAVSDEFVKGVMAFIESQIENYKYEKLIVTPFGDYMPAGCLEQQNTDTDGKNKGLVYHGNRIYRKADFRLFLSEEDSKKYALKKLFISYSSKQSDFMRRFEVHLAPLVQNGQVDIWHDRMISAGSAWNPAIQQKLETSDIVVFLLSPDFLNTPYVVQEEIPKALQMHKEGKTKIFPVELIPCGWGRLPMLSDLQIVSDSKSGEKQILTVGEADNGVVWEKIINELLEVIRTD